MKAQDRYVGIGLLTICVILFVNTFSFRTTHWEALGMAFWPRLLLGLLAILAVHLIIKGNLDPAKSQEPLARGAFLTAAAGFVYVLLLEPLGFLIVTPIFIFLFSVVISRRRIMWRLLESAATACVGTVVIYAVFELGLKLVLPSGLLE